MTRGSSTRICGVSDMKCFENVENSLRNFIKDCKCYEPCENIKYNIEAQIVNAEIQSAR